VRCLAERQLRRSPGETDLRPDSNGTAPVSGQNKAATLPQSDGIICLRLQPKDADIFPCSKDCSDEWELLPPLVGVKVLRLRYTDTGKQVTRQRWCDHQIFAPKPIQRINFRIWLEHWRDRFCGFHTADTTISLETVQL
jgi:hypothetical protein